jgi:hypothetical protein
MPLKGHRELQRLGVAVDHSSSADTRGVGWSTLRLLSSCSGAQLSSSSGTATAGVTSELRLALGGFEE